MIDKTAMAIEGMPADDVADRIWAMEMLYQREMARERESRATIEKLEAEYVEAKNAPFWKLTRNTAEIQRMMVCEYSDLLDERIEPMGVLRAMVAELARERTKQAADARAESIRGELLADRERMKTLHDGFAFWLRNSFPMEHEEAEARHMDTFELAKSLLMRIKNQNGAGNPSDAKARELLGRFASGELAKEGV